MTGSKRDEGLKTHDRTAFAIEAISEDPEHEAYWVQEELDDGHSRRRRRGRSTIVLQFEDAISETTQNDSEMCAFYTSYQEAGKSLSKRCASEGSGKSRRVRRVFKRRANQRARVRDLLRVA